MVGAARERKHAGDQVKEGRPSDPHKGSSFFISGSILPSLHQFSWNFDSPVLFSVSICLCFSLFCGNPNTKIQCFFSRHFLGEGLGSSFQSFCLDESFTSELQREGLSGLSLRLACDSQTSL